jgi:small subunit ribosomal protein S2
MRAIHLYCELVAAAVLDGLQAELAASGVDIGAREQVPEPALAAADITEEPAAELDMAGLESASKAESATVQ